MRPVLEIERFESIEQFQIHYREWKKKTKKKTQPSRNYDHLAKNYIKLYKSIAQRLTNPYCLF